MSALGEFKNEYKITDYLDNCCTYLYDKNYIGFDFEYSIMAKDIKK